MKKEHGADIKYISRKKNIDRQLLDYSSNINIEMPKCIEIALENTKKNISSYPDFEYFELRSEIARYLNKISKKIYTYKNICVGNGASELISLLISKSSKGVGIIEPTFSEYRDYAECYGKKIEVEYMVDTGCEMKFPDIGDKKFNDFLSRIDILFICNPNNPDGCVRDISEIARICGEKNILLVVDETFIEFCDSEEDYTALKFDFCRVVVIRAFTKFFGTPGIRLGYISSLDEKIIEDIVENQGPWSVNTLADEFGKIALRDKEFIKDSKEYYRCERERFLKKLSKVEGLSVYNTDSAFVLIRIKNKDIDASILKEIMIDKFSIVIRDCKSFASLGNKYFRLAIKDKKSNDYVYSSLSEAMDILKKGKHSYYNPKEVFDEKFK